MAGYAHPTRLSLGDGRRVVLRHAEPCDAEGIIELNRTIAAEAAYTPHYPDEVDGDAERVRQRIIEHRANPDRLWLVAVLDGSPLPDCAEAPEGVVDKRPTAVHAAIRVHAGTLRRVAHRATVAVNVAPGLRGAGLGRAMMVAAIGWARDHPRIERLVLEVYADNQVARRLYESLGFVVEGRREREIRMGPGDYRDDLIMALAVKQA